MTWVDDLIGYVSKFEPRFPTFVAGAAADDVAAIRTLAGTAVPAELEELWARMGGEYGGVFNRAAISAFADDVAEAYREAARRGPPDGCVLFAKGTMGIDALAICGASGQVVHVEGSRRIGPWAASLPGFVFQEAFQVFELARFPHRVTWTVRRHGRDQVVSRFATAMASAGMDGRPWCDAWNWCGGLGEEAAAMACVRGAAGGWCEFAGVAEATVAAIAEAVDHALGSDGAATRAR